MSSQVRERERGAARKQKQPEKEEEEDTKKEQGPVDLEPNIFVAISIVLVFAAIVGTFIYYKFDGRNDGPFYTFINDNILPKNRYQKM